MDARQYFYHDGVAQEKYTGEGVGNTVLIKKLVFTSNNIFSVCCLFLLLKLVHLLSLFIQYMHGV